MSDRPYPLPKGLLFLLLGVVSTPSLAAIPASSPLIPPTTMPTAMETAGAKPVVDGFYASLLDTMKMGEKLGYAGRKSKLDPVIRKSFDLDLMARAVSGPAWYSMKSEEQAAVTAALADWAVGTYANRFNRFDGERFSVGETIDAGRGTVQVKSSIKPNGDTAVVLNYRLRQVGKAWRIVDVYLNGTVSQLANWRAEFAGVLQQEGAKGLVNRLHELSTDLAKSK